MYHLTDTLLTVKDLSLKFGDKLILRDINLEIKDIVTQNSITGQVITLLGKSGVGKSQLMLTIAGLQSPTSGQVLVGKDQVPVEPGIIGMVLQDYPLFEHRTVIANMELVSDDKEKIDYYLHEFDIYDCKQKYPPNLSGGQRQRSAIVQQLLCSDKFILLDEPFSGLDPVATEKLCRNINKVANQNSENTVIISSHILEPSLAISDTVWMIGHEYVQLTEDPVGPKQKVEGAKILRHIDLAAQGMAWRKDIRRDPMFVELVEDIRSYFNQI